MADEAQRPCIPYTRKRPIIEESDEWFLKHGAKKVHLEANRTEVVEVMKSGISLTQKGIKIVWRKSLLETIRGAINKHDWLLVSKCIEGLSDETKKNSVGGCWIIWNGGFLVLVNVFKDDVNKIVEFSRVARPTLRCYPRRLGIETATWLTQKGYFLKGIEIMNELHLNNDLKVHYTPNHRNNPKRYQIELIYNLITSVYTYSGWKRDSSRIDEHTSEADIRATRDIGKIALEQFEKTLEWAEKADADVTIFIQPLIELTIIFKTEFEARRLFLRLVEKYDRNFVLEELYCKFLDQYFPFLEEEVQYFVECRKRYRFMGKDNQLKLFTFRNWKNNLLKKEERVVLQSKPLPSYRI